ncbi:MAG: ABC transporter permease [Anaerolineae bacterium]|nr:ABC transporter permease [Anaerolineae bacterium]
MTSHVEPARAEHSQDIRKTALRFARKNASQMGIVSVLIVMWIWFFFAAPETFQSKEIYASLMFSVPLYGIVALPLTMVVIAGEMDLSFGSIMAVGMVGFWYIYDETGSLELAFVSSLVTGFLAGLVNGIIIVKLGIPSLIATIGTMFFWRGVVQVTIEGSMKTFFELRNANLSKVLVGETNNFWEHEMFWMIVVAVIVWIILNRHQFGAHIYLIGDNEASARLMGVNVDRTRMLIFAYVGLASAFAGVMSSLQLSTFFPTLGEGQLMPTLSSVFLGGTSVFGGSGTIFGTFVGCFVFGFIKPGLIAIGMTGYWTQLINGSVIVASVAMHMFLRRRME